VTREHLPVLNKEGARALIESRLRWRGLTKGELARALAMSPGTLSRKLGSRYPYDSFLPDDLDRIAAYLDLSAEQRETVRASYGYGAAVEPVPAPSVSAPSSRPRGNLPLPLTSFIGRGQELAEVHRLLASCRLLTLIGPGGSGKTRLALEAAGDEHRAPRILRQAQDERGEHRVPSDPTRSLPQDWGRAARGAVAPGPDPAQSSILPPQAGSPLAESGDLFGSPQSWQDVWLVELAPVSDERRVAEVVAATLGVDGIRGRTPEAGLLEYLTPRRVLLVLDNCEHLLAACADLAARLLRAAPALTILATSREALGVPGERIVAVPPLSLPEPSSHSLWVSLAASEAVQLFVERARLSRPGFGLTEANAEAVVQICRRLDGMPLALELAAARTQVLSVQQIADRLDDRFRLLAAGGRLALPHHQTLRAAMDWSHDLLSEPERILFRRLAIFSGSFDIEDAEGLAGTQGSGLRAQDSAPDESLRPEAPVLDLLAQLVAKSLIVVGEQEGGATYRFLETVRTYALEKLVAAGELPELRRRHRAWYRALAQRAQAELIGPDQRAWLLRLDREGENLRSALAACLDADGDLTEGLELAASLRQFWDVRGYIAEGRMWLERLLERAGGVDPAARAAALLAAGWLALRQSEFDLARQRIEESLALSRSRADEHAVAAALAALATVARFRGDYGAARQQAEQALALFRRLGQPLGTANALNDLAAVSEAEGEPQTAWRLWQESLALYRSAGNKQATAVTLTALGGLAHNLGDDAGSRQLQEEALAVHRELDNRQGIASALNNLGLLTQELADHATARACFEEAIAINRELGNRRSVANTLNNLGLLAYQNGEDDEAAACLDSALALFRAVGSQQGAAIALNNLGHLARRRGDADAALALHRESLALYQALKSRLGVAQCLWGPALLAAALGQPGRAVRLFGAAEAQRARLGYRLWPSLRADYDRARRELSERLGARSFAESWESGAALSLDQAVAEALEGRMEARSAPVSGASLPLS
jgi:predicted ATPase/Tfp pilus assembly protein PilF